MSLGVTKTLETIKDLQAVAIDALNLVKDASGRKFVAVFADVVSTGTDVQELVADAPLALPELKDLDAQEAGQISTAAYGLVVAVLAALKS